jgi:hypothetical protein
MKSVLFLISAVNPSVRVMPKVPYKLFETTRPFTSSSLSGTDDFRMQATLIDLAATSVL